MNKPTVEVSIPQLTEVAVTDAQQALATARSFVIKTPDQSVELQASRQAINTKIKALEEERLSMTRPLDASKKRIMEHFERPISFLKQALAADDAEILRWNRQVETERREAQRKAELEAQRERDRLQAIADETRRRAEAEQRERDRVAREARERAEAEQRRLDEEAAAARRAGDAVRAEEARREAERVRLANEEAQAEQLRRDEAAALTAQSKAALFEERAATHVAPVITAEVGSQKGVGLRDNWTFTLKDVSKLDRSFMIPDEVKIGKLVKSMRKDAESIVGLGSILVENRPIVASRRA